MNTAELPPLIPRKILFDNPDRTMVRLSPDGQFVSYLASHNGVLNVWVGPSSDPKAAKVVTADQGRGIRMYGWAYTNQHLLYIQDKGGDENWHLYVVDLISGETRDLTPFEGIQVMLQEASPSRPTEILIRLNRRVPQLHDLYTVNLLSGELEMVLENEGFIAFITDSAYQVRFGAKATPEGGTDVYQWVDDAWIPYSQIEMEDAMTTQPLGMDEAGEILYLMDSRGRDTAALFAINLTDGSQTVLAESPLADVSDTMNHPTQKHIQAAAFTRERKVWQILDESIRADLDYLASVADGEVEVADRTENDQHWIVAYLMDNGPVRYYHYDRAKRHATYLFSDRESLEGLPLASMHPVVIPSRDGLELISYLTLPTWTTQEATSPAGPRPAEPLPLVLLVHGGPWARDNWGYHPYHQLLANRGYAVLSVNFRGSTGFGKAFGNAGNLEWGRKMHDDLLDAVDWAVAQGIADRERVAIMGGSYGGYATLAGLTMTPEIFACGVDIVGPSNLVTLLQSVPEYWKPMLDVMLKRVGDFRTEEGLALLKERSPLTYADQIRRPLLIGQGANDPRVKQAESDQIVQAMQKNQIPVSYVLYPDEGHGFVRPENRLSFTAMAEAFLARCLEGDRFEPIGDSFQGSSLTVPVGGDGIPGVKEALTAT